MLKTQEIIEEKKKVSLQSNISNTPFDQKSPQPPEQGVLQRHRQTEGHRDSMTENGVCNSIFCIFIYGYFLFN